MNAPPQSRTRTSVHFLPVEKLVVNPFSVALYGDPALEIEGLLESIAAQGIIEPLVVAPDEDGFGWEVLSGHRRLACAQRLGLADVPCVVRSASPGPERQRLVIDSNRQRNKTFSQRMREADALEQLLSISAAHRRQANLRRGTEPPERRNSDARGGRTDESVARAIGLGGKDVYRQARAIWQAARNGDVRGRAAVDQLDSRTKTIHAAYKDLRRRDRFAVDFKPTPYDVWSFRHDRAFGVPHPGSIPAEIIAHAVYYFSPPDGLVVDPMAGGGTTLDVCVSMGRRCLAYDLHPVRPDVRPYDIRSGFPPECAGCDLIFCDPPYHTMLAGRYGVPSETVGEAPLSGWIAFLQDFSRLAFMQLRPGGHIALLLANQTEKDLPAGYGYLDHAFFGYEALRTAGFWPVRRISCPMSGGYLPQHVRRARADGRLLGLVRDLLVMRKPLEGQFVGSPPASS